MCFFLVLLSSLELPHDTKRDTHRTSLRPSFHLLRIDCLAGLCSAGKKIETIIRIKLWTKMPLSGTYDGAGNLKKSQRKMSGINGGEDAKYQQKPRQQYLYDCLPGPHGLLMDEALWSKLPVELLERVLANMPIDAMLRFRSVCKAWNAFISSYGFAELCYKTPNKGPWCLAITPEYEGSAVYDVELDKWYHLPLPHIAAKLGMRPFSSVGGFVCFKNFDNSTFFVYNPLTRSCSALTPKRGSMGSEKDKAWVVADQSEGFSVVVVRESGRYEVYDSYSNQWSKPGMLPQTMKISQESCFPARSVANDGILYLVSKSPYDLVTYDTITGAWSKLYVPWPEQSWNHILAEHRGRICMLALQRENDDFSFCEWELQPTRMLWVKVETMPKKVCPEVFGDSNNEWHVHGLANRDLVLLRFVNTKDQEYLVLYTRTLKLWKRISNLPTFPDRQMTDRWIPKVSNLPTFPDREMTERWTSKVSN